MIKVLVVDDDHLVRRGFISMMPWSKYGLEVVGEAGNGKKALEFLAEHDIDLLITDLAMPSMSGIELMKQVKRTKPDVHMVVLTFHQDFELIQESLRLGALDYMTKVELEHEQMDEVLQRIVQRIREQAAPVVTRTQPELAAEEAGEDDGQRYSAEVRASIKKAVELIGDGLQEELHLPEVAHRVNMSRSYFSRCFHDLVGKTFNDYVRELRVERAKSLLKTTSRNIGWVAAQSGYPNEKYFGKVFRELTGVLPSEFRKMEKSHNPSSI
jgi:YesN/AraC family two-component response regulator